MLEEPSFLQYAFVYLAAAVLSVPIAKRIGLGSVLGYLFAGTLIGPWGMGLISEVENVLHFAEFGVVLLLFLIGLELSPSRLWEMRRSVFGLGLSQVLSGTLLISAICLALGLEGVPSLVIGVTLALSSTAFVLQMLQEKNQMKTAHGRAGFSILLFQDLAVIPLLAIFPLLGPHSSDATSPWLLALKALVAIGLVVGGGRLILRPALRGIAQSRTKEIFTAASLLLVLGVALLMESIGLSMALGSFLAGVILADSEYRHELEADIQPFKGLLLGLFFIAVGMSVDLGLIFNRPLEIFLAVVALMSVKWFALWLIGKVMQLHQETRLSLAALLCQGGEFAFVLFNIANANQILDRPTVDFLIVVVTISMAVTPLIFSLNTKLQSIRSIQDNQDYDSDFENDQAVIIAGFGRFGQIVARVLRLQKVPYITLDHSPDQIEISRRFGSKVYYGDAGRLDLLEAAGAEHACAFVLAIDDVESSIQIAKTVRSHYPKLKILARARNRRHALELMDLNIEVIHRETFQSSLELARDTLVAIGKKPSTADEAVRVFRKHDEETLVKQHAVKDDEEQVISHAKQALNQLEELFVSDPD